MNRPLAWIIAAGILSLALPGTCGAEGLGNDVVAASTAAVTPPDQPAAPAEPTTPPAPKPAAEPAPTARADKFPRITEVSWEPVPGARRYGLEVDAFNCRGSGTWCSETGKMPLTARDIKGTSYTFFWPVEKKGRWRFWAVEPDGTEGPKSDWKDFPAGKQEDPVQMP